MSRNEYEVSAVNIYASSRCSFSCSRAQSSDGPALTNIAGFPAEIFFKASILGEVSIISRFLSIKPSS